MHQRQQAGCDVEDENPSNDDGGGCDDKDARGYQGFDRRRVCDSSGARLAMMEHNYQRLFGGLLGLFLVGPAVTILIARQLQLQPGRCRTLPRGRRWRGRWRVDGRSPSKPVRRAARRRLAAPRVNQDRRHSVSPDGRDRRGYVLGYR